MTDTRRAILVIPLLLAACSSGASPTPGTPTAPAATPSTAAPTATAAIPTAAATDAPTPGASEPAGSPSPIATPGASLSADLDALIPTEIAGIEMTIEPASDPAQSFMILWNDEQVAQDLLDALGASSSDIDVVFSYPAESTPNRIFVDAYRVAGADGIALRDGMVENYRVYLGEFTEVTVTEVTVSGKEALILLTPTAPAEQERHYYAVGDIVFMVQGDPFELVEEAFTLIP